MIKSVGIIGLGKMGHPMARHLLAGQFEVFGFDIDPAKIEAAKLLGVSMCASPAQLADNSDLVIVIVGFDSEVMSVLRGKDGVFQNLRKGAVIGIASTVTIDTMNAIAVEVDGLDKGAAVLDIPICRGEPAAEAGTLLMLVGGEQEPAERCHAAFSTFSSDIHHLGNLGAGQAGKLVNNLLLWSCISANYEGLKLGEALGLDPKRLREALVKSSGRNFALETWDRPRAMPWAEKDMTIVMQEADRMRLSLPTCAVVKEVVKGIKIERGLPTPGVVCEPPIAQSGNTDGPGIKKEVQE